MLQNIPTHVIAGPLGAGKTTFIQGLARGFGIIGQVTSPTFTIFTLHRGTRTLVHLDAYRLDGTRLWRINLGINIRAGAHYTQFMVYDLDGDGRTDMIFTDHRDFCVGSRPGWGWRSSMPMR